MWYEGVTGPELAVELKHVVTQIIGTGAAALLVRWGWREVHRDWREHRRLALVMGPYIDWRSGASVVGGIAVVVPLLLVVMKLELIPKGSPALFAAMLGWLSLAVVFFTLGIISVQARRYAKGWLTVVGDDTLLVEADGGTATVKLRPGAAIFRFIESGVGLQYVQLEVEDGNVRVHLWGMLGLRQLPMVSAERLTQPRGLMVAGSLNPLNRWLSPYLRKAPSARS